GAGDRLHRHAGAGGRADPPVARAVPDRGAGHRGQLRRPGRLESDEDAGTVRPARDAGVSLRGIGMAKAATSRSGAAKKAAQKRKRRQAGTKAAATRKRRAAATKAKKTEFAKLQRAERARLEKLWGDHLAGEFTTKDVEATLATMVDDASVNHVPVNSGGRGKEQLRTFYRDDFIPSWPDDLQMTLT